jgi:hypothetical protein
MMSLPRGTITEAAGVDLCTWRLDVLAISVTELMVESPALRIMVAFERQSQGWSVGMPLGQRVCRSGRSGRSPDDLRADTVWRSSPVTDPCP